MDEQESRSQAALQELNAINQMLTQRCVNLAAETSLLLARNQTLTAQAEKQAEELAALKSEKEPLKAVG